MSFARGLGFALGQLNRITQFVVLDDVDEITHQHQTAATRLFEIFVQGWIGYCVRIETLPFVGDAGMKLVARQRNHDAHAFAGITLVSMLDGIHDGLFHCHVNAKNVLFVPVVFFKLFQYLTNDSDAVVRVTRNLLV